MTPTRRQTFQAAAGALTPAGLGCSRRPEAAPAAPDPTGPPLEARAIPSTGLRLPVVGLGTYIAFDVSTAAEVEEARAALRAFVQRGGSFIDTSPMYGAAEALAGRLAAELAVRPRLVFATKVWTHGQGPGVSQMERSVHLLDGADLIQVHNLVDVETHLFTLARWRSEGRVRHVGVTHYDEGAYGELERVMRSHRLDTVQVNFSVAERRAAERIIPLARDRGMAVIVNRPFAGGGVFARLRSRSLPAWAGEAGCASWAQVLLKYVLSEPGVTCAIPGTRNPRHVLDNLGAGVEPSLTAAQRADVRAAL